ncbi:hypothetical protein TDB9533_03983 [Thalassocella blandensis]|nr:hypothetical protein TDB9533_03983 [Thalassocella blandensis]
MLDLCNTTNGLGHLARQSFFAMHAHYQCAIDYRDRINKNEDSQEENQPNEIPPSAPDEVPPINPKPPFEVPAPTQPDEVPHEQPNELPEK